MVPHPETARKFITLVTSSEGHNYTPPEKDLENCMGAFIHYFPTNDPYWTILPGVPKLYPIPLGVKEGFNPISNRPIASRKYDVTFLGQLDPYRRADFYQFCLKVAERFPNSKIGFYEGWNKGLDEGEYADIMGDTKIALVPWGSASLNTFRYYEAMASGCIILRDKRYVHSHIEPSDYMGRDVGGWNDHFYLLDLIGCILKNEDLQRFSRNNVRNYYEDLSPEACASKIMEIVT
jgi:glycosyltransferase involved in cell wall biosynthesis